MNTEFGIENSVQEPQAWQTPLRRLKGGLFCHKISVSPSWPVAVSGSDIGGRQRGLFSRGDQIKYDSCPGKWRYIIELEMNVREV